ncbi:hypothetical protein ACFC6L_30265 [Kitasatospora phosalacinea]|uniref:hypothetical protein n=1 Tax=Kitasatospora phosalacinea TaxID=2065 RepID=UPI0035E1E98F
MGKIYYGLMFREMSLLWDRRDLSGGTIIDPVFLASFRMHHLLIQAARGVVRWQSSQHPASIFVFRAMEPTELRARFDYVDIINVPFFAIRVGRTVVVSALQDWGALAEAVELPGLEAAKRLDLHPQQFREVAALAAYTTKLFNRVPKHLLHAAHDHVEVVTLPIAGLSARSVFDDFVPTDYAHVLAWLLDHPVEKICNGQQLLTLLQDSQGNPYRMPLSADESASFDITI